MIHSNHKPDTINYGIVSGQPKLFTECHCGAIKPIPVHMINMDELCSIIKHQENKKQ